LGPAAAVHHEAAEVTKTTKNITYRIPFVRLRVLRAFVMHKC